jgi:hypothetical protein
MPCAQLAALYTDTQSAAMYVLESTRSEKRRVHVDLSPQHGLEYTMLAVDLSDQRQISIDHANRAFVGAISRFWHTPTIVRFRAEVSIPEAPKFGRRREQLSTVEQLARLSVPSTESRLCV